MHKRWAASGVALWLALGARAVVEAQIIIPNPTERLRGDDHAPPQRPPPAAEQLDRLTAGQLRERLAASLWSLKRNLEAYQTGAGWEKYLQLDDLEAVTQAEAAPPDAATRKRLHGILDRFDSLARRGEYRSISLLGGFQTARGALREYLLPPAKRQQRLLANHLQDLSRALGSVGTGASWRRHLQLDELGKIARSQEEPTPAGRKQLEAILSRLDHISRQAKYRGLTRLQGFTSTHQGLKRYIQTLRISPGRSPTVSLVGGVAGDVQMLRPGTNTWEPAEPKVALPDGAKLKTGKKAYADLHFPGEVKVRIQESTQITINRRQAPSGQAEIDIKLAQGSLKAATPQSRSASSHVSWAGMKVSTPGCTVSLAGTQLEIDYQSRFERTMVTVYKGSALCRHTPSGDEVRVRVGRRAVFSPAGLSLSSAPPQPDDWWPDP